MRRRNFIWLGLLPIALEGAQRDLALYRVESKVTDCVRRTDGGTVTIERLYASLPDGSDDVVYIVRALTASDGTCVERFEWQVASTKQKLKVHFNGWNGTTFSWRSAAPYGGHAGSFDVAEIPPRLKILSGDVDREPALAE